MSDYAEWYDIIYSKRPKYNPIDKQKLDIVKQALSKIDKRSTLLDVGCGRGHFLKQFIDMGITSFGIEPSKECSIRYLNNLPHEVTDFESYAEKLPEDLYDIVFCTDVLEHIKPEDLDSFLFHLSRTAPYSLLGIANHSDVQEGMELHLIQKPWEWWEKELLKHYTTVEFRISLHDNKFFFVDAWRC